MNDRRPLASRNLGVFRVLASRLARARVAPNAISVSSVGFAALAGLALASTRLGPGWTPWAWVAGALGIQLRLVANLLDGMVAVEGGLGTPVGGFYNEVPDRIADTLILVGAGAALADLRMGLLLGFGASWVAVMTAYIRALGASLGVGQAFLGPMAKPQRMALITVAAMISACGFAEAPPQQIMAVALWIVVAGGLITCARRLWSVGHALRSR